MVSTTLSPAWLRFKGLYFGNYHAGLSISNMNFLIADVIVCIKYNDNFLTRGYSKVKSKQLSEFASRAMGFTHLKIKIIEKFELKIKLTKTKIPK